MFRNFIETLFSRGFSAITNFGIILFTARILGAEGRGELSLFFLNIGIVVIFQNIGSGSAITYFINKGNLKRIWIYSFFWCVITTIVISILLLVNKLISPSHILYISAISFLLGLISNNQNILLGKEQIRQMNWVEILKSFIVLLALIIFYLFFDVKYNVQFVFKIYFFSYLVLFFFSFFLILPFLKNGEQQESLLKYKTILKFGIQIQSNNFLQLINYRFTYYIIEYFYGLHALGIISVAISIAENVWIITKSTSTVLYSKLLNEIDSKRKIDLTVYFTNISVFYSTLLCLILLCVPDSLFSLFFGKEFQNLSIYFISYIPAVIMLSFFSQINHFFTAKNQNLINIKATGLGAITTIIFSLIFVPNYGIVYACICISISYFFMLIFLIRQFSFKNSVHWTIFFKSYNNIFKSLDKHE
ncbi:MAG: polysaccharide biosynthesis C-terminal domain-containing protein [Flavobacteriia bacterium]|nr:polysaccharide biosynthesis C-terminal domain-containing protein [Flavobacteriia bacterium]